MNRRLKKWLYPNHGCDGENKLWFVIASISLFLALLSIVGFLINSIFFAALSISLGTALFVLNFVQLYICEKLFKKEIEKENSEEFKQAMKELDEEMNLQIDYSI